MTGRGKNNWHMRGGKVYGKSYTKSKNVGQNNRFKPNTSSDPIKKQLNIDNLFEVENCPYKGWKLYFPVENYKENSNTHLKIQVFEEYITKNKEIFIFDSIVEKKYFVVDLKHLLQDEVITDRNSFENDLNIHPQHTLSCLEMAMFQVVYKFIEENIELNMPEEQKATPILQKINVRLLNHSPVIQLKNLKVNYFGKLASVRGTVIRVSNTKLICHSMAFKCNNCEATQVVQQPDGVYALPSQCPTNMCKNHTKFVPLLSSPHTVTNNWQLLKLQESVGNEQVFYFQ